MLRYLPVNGWPASLDDMVDTFAGRLNVYGVMANHPALLRAWAGFRMHVVEGSSLDPQLSEVVILRTGHLLGSSYEWAHHVMRAEKLGMEEARIASIRGPIGEMSVADRILCGAVDQLFAHHRLDVETQEQLSVLIGTEATLDLMATVAHYMMLGFMLNSVPVPLDAPVADHLTRRVSAR